MKVLFLDVDGVLNNFHMRNFGESFHPNSCAALNHILAGEPELKIVVSSAWRMHGLAYMCRVLMKNGIDPERVIDITGHENGIRGYQIQCWLDRNPGVTNMVILDDEGDMGELIPFLMRTNSFVGLTQEGAEKALDILKKPTK